MILNERQYRTSQRKLREALFDRERLESGEGQISADDRRVAAASLKAFADQVRTEVAEYEALRSGATPVLPIVDLDDLPLALIRARIAQQLTQAQLAERLAMKEQQLQRYEMTRYSGANLERLKEIARTLGVRIEGSAVMEPTPTEHEPIWRKPLILMILGSLHATWQRPAEGVLELQKLLVNVDAALRSQLRFHAFEFEPYKLGPYDPFIEDDVERLVALGMVEKHIDLATVKDDQVLVAELRTVPLSSTRRAAEWLAIFEAGEKVAPVQEKRRIREIVNTIATDYGALGTSDLLARTYAEHPEWTGRSEIRDEMSRRIAEKRTW